METKERKISFHTIIKRKWKTGEETPFNELPEVINYILKIKRLDRCYDLKDSKFCFLEFAKQEINSKGEIIISGFFKSARNKFRPNLIDRITGEERKSPKKLTEGDIEKTHFAVKLTKEETFLTLEINGHGVTINQIINYLSFYTKQYIATLKEKKGFSLIYTKIGRGDFLEAVKKMKRARVAEVYFDKSLLGSKCLDFSNRTTSLKRELVLTATAEKRDNIEETAIDFYNSFSSGKSSISKVRIYGRDENNTEVILDTSFVEKIDSLNLSINQETGELSTPELTRGLKTFLKDL
jgi:hypothetical protein